MEGSGLYDDLYINQIQGVSWLHGRDRKNQTQTGKSEGGEFFLYPGGPGGKVMEVPTKYNEAV